MENTNYESLLEKIKNWKGIDKQYWMAVELLIENNCLKDHEIAACKKGLEPGQTLTCYAGDLVIHKMMQLADFCKQEIEKNKSISGIIENLKNEKRNGKK